MARTKRKKASDGDGIAAVLLVICVGIYNWIVGHAELAIIIVVAVIAFIILLLVVKKMHIRRYWAWFYNRERGLGELGTQYLLQQETDDALNKITRKVDDCRNSDYTKLSSACKKAYGSDEIAWLDGDSFKYTDFKSQFSGEDLVSSINLKTDITLPTLYCKTNKNGGYAFVLLPDAIYSFIIGDSAYTFVGVYEKNALSLKVDKMHFRKTYTHITDMSHQPRDYFLRYCDIKDSHVAGSCWQYETKAGYRDGRRQGNNHFIVEFIYSKMDFEFGNISSSTVFSCTDSGDMLKESLEGYKKMPRQKDHIRLIEPQYAEDDILATVSRENPQVTDAECEVTNTIDASLDHPIITHLGISCDEARSRNREIAKALQARLNEDFKDLEFKIFQIKKQREDRKLQDASVYTYLPFNSSRYCLEYNIKTKLENGETVLEYILTADDDGVLQADECQRLIRLNKMRKVGASYRMDFGYDYSKCDLANSVEHMHCTIKTSVNEALENSSKLLRNE